MKVGDYVIPNGQYLWEYFPNGPRKIKAIRETNGYEHGDAISVKGVKFIQFWSNYLMVIKHGQC